MIKRVIAARRRNLGGFDVERLLPGPGQRMVGPFLFFDRMGPVDFPPGIPRSVDVRPHPHIGLATLTYLFQGEIMHRDSVGSEQAILPGEVNWMIAGRGITHSERFERARLEGGSMDGIQAWAALPLEYEEEAPGFWHHAEAELPVAADGAARFRLIAGEALGLKSPVPTRSPLFYMHCELPAGARVPLPAFPERAAYVVRGSAQAGAARIAAGQMAVFEPGAAADLAAAEPSVLMLLGGEPVGERFIEWNFVSSSRERIAQAKADWRAGRMKLPDLDRDESMPLPAEPLAPPNPMS